MQSPENPKYTVELLREYSTAALQNASQLLEEATLLFEHGHMARAYFLAVACIEETGKALQAFYAQGRNLEDSTVATKLKRVMDDHSQKINAAFTAWILASQNIHEAVMPAVKLMIQLKRGREPSMYTDIRFDSMKIQVPEAMARRTAADGCISLAKSCLGHAQNHIAEKLPEPKSRAEDQLFTMKTSQFMKILNTEDFWWYYISLLQAGNRNVAEAVIQYQKVYLMSGRHFKATEDSLSKIKMDKPD